jgi:hypothetical protein
VFEELAALAPGGGLAASVIALLAWYTKTSREDRKEYRDALASAKADFEERLKAEHARLLETDMNAQTEVDELRRRLADADTVIQGERAARRDAELDVESFKIRLQQMTWRYRLAKGEDVDLDI